MSEIILHHYPQSPVSEKVRVGLGIKGLSWRSVEIPRIPPKPDLMPLTGGYRRTPVMQIGADIYCDSDCILREIDRRHPEPTFYPGGGTGMPWAVSRWTSGELFDQVVRIAFGSSLDQVPKELLEDRARLYFGADFDWNDVEAELPHLVSQVRTQFSWIAERVKERAFLLGAEPGLPDVFTYYLIWFLRGRWSGGPDLIAEFPSLEAWEERVKAFGHGTSQEMTSQEALAIAREAEPSVQEKADPKDPQGLTPGMDVSVRPVGGDLDPPVTGVIRAIDRETIALVRQEPDIGAVAVHFPRVGYRVESTA